MVPAVACRKIMEMAKDTLRISALETVSSSLQAMVVFLRALRLKMEVKK